MSKYAEIFTKKEYEITIKKKNQQAGSGSIKKAVILIMTAVICLSLPVKAYSLEQEYIGSEIGWHKSSGEVVTILTNTETYSGLLNYYADDENYSIYIRISYSDVNLKSDGNEVYVNFNVKNQSREYYFAVDRDGMLNSDKETESSFGVMQSFGAASEQGQEIYIGIEFLNKKDKKENNEIGISIYINGVQYEICEGIPLNYYKEEVTTAKETKEGSTQNSSTQAKSTTAAETKYKYTGTTAGKNAYSYAGSNNTQEESSLPAASENTESGEITAEEQSEIKEEFSPAAKILLALGGVCIGTGALLFLSSVLKKDGNTENYEE